MKNFKINFSVKKNPHLSLRINRSNGDGGLLHGWLTAIVDTRHYNFPIQNVFDALNGEQNFLLMTQFDDSNVLEVLLVELCGVARCLKTLFLERNYVLFETQ